MCTHVPPHAEPLKSKGLAHYGLAVLVARRLVAAARAGRIVVVAAGAGFIIA
jgi:hypothetical protein